jgi:hypothetical protein
MDVFASSSLSLEPDSADAGRLAGEAIRQAFGAEKLQVALVYATVNHDQPAVLEALGQVLGPDVLLLGCSAQGMARDEEVSEEGLAVGVMGFGGGALRHAAAVERDIQMSSLEKGQQLAKKLKADLACDPNLVLLLYDPLCGADIEKVLLGMRGELSCPIVGGGAGQPWGPPVCTFQYWKSEVFSSGVVALALAGPFSTEIGICHGTAPTGVAVTVTKVEGNRILEIDGRSAIDIWREHTGCAEGEMVHQEHMASWAIGIERRFSVAGEATQQVARMIRGAFGFDLQAGAVILQTAVPEGARVMFHHRTVENVLQGTAAMASELAGRLRGRTPWAILGFECAARTFPFLGAANTVEEHLGLRRAVGPGTPWLGMMAWGEIAPAGGEPAFHNYTYPLVVLAQ